MRVIDIAPLPQGWKADALTNPRTLGSYASAGTATEFIEGANFHSNNSNGGIYNFGAGTSSIGNGDRAVGGLNTSNNPTSINVYLDLTISGATPVAAATVTYDLEKYRNGRIPTAVTLYYSLTDGSAASWVQIPTTATISGDDGNTNGFSPAPDASQTQHVSGTITFATSRTTGQHVYFAWDISPTAGNSAANSAALGLDNVNIAAASAAPAGLYYRSFTSGNWNLAATWESTLTPGNPASWVNPAGGTPDFTDNTITVQNGHTVTVTTAETADELTVDAGGKITITSPGTLSIYDGTGFDITVNGTVDGTGKLILRSYQGGSSNIGTSTIGTSTGTITATTTVERFLSAASNRSAWRLLTAPVTGAANNSIWVNWQNSGVYAAGVGTTVTGPTYVAVGGTPGSPVSDANGLDYNTSGYSLKSFDMATGNLTAVTNTKTTPLFGTTNNSYFIFINGDRHAYSPYTSGPQNTTTLLPTGTLQMGNITDATNAAANGFTLIGNPYASHVDLDLFRLNNTTSNLKTTYYYWDPYLTGQYGVGGYVTVSYDAGGAETITPQGGGLATSDETRYLQSGQAMFVQSKSPAAGIASITFNENQKAPTTVNNIFRVQGAAKVENMRLNLNVLSGTAQIIDGIVAAFDKSYSADVDNYDAVKFYNVGESIAFMRNGTSLSIERRPTVTGSDVLNINLAGLKANVPYQFEISPSFNSTVLTAFLIDNYLKTTTPVDLNKTTTVNFTINSDAASTGANRFYISFAKPAAVIAGKDGMSVFPNPVTNGVINLQMNNMAAGIYNVRVFNAVGQVILNRQINHATGNSTETIQLGKGVVKGVYQLEVIKSDNAKFSSKVMAN